MTTLAESIVTRSLLGGLCIGIAALLMLALSGRILGVSGITFGLIRPKTGDTLWRVLFVVGLFLGALLIRLILPSIADFTITVPPLALVAGGLLVGYGTRLAGGCTSGHGICGVGRLSFRSLVGTAVFIATGMVTVGITRHVLGG